MAITTIFPALLDHARAPARGRIVPPRDGAAAGRLIAWRRPRLLASWRRDLATGRPVCTWRETSDEDSAAGQRSLVLRDPWAGVVLARLCRAASTRRLAA